MTKANPARWAPLPTAQAPRSASYAPKMVVGEVKPHTPSGISAGITQLRKRKAAIERAGHNVNDVTFNLITYRPTGKDPREYQLSISNPGQLWTAVVRGGPPPAFRLMGGTFSFAQATRMIPLHECTSSFGTAIEKEIRQRYGQWMRSHQGHTSFRVPPKQRGGKGADLPFKQRELAEFLRELAAELEAGY